MPDVVVNDDKLKEFTSRVFQKLGVSKDDSDIGPERNPFARGSPVNTIR
jgi:hypothetical protein